MLYDSCSTHPTEHGIEHHHLEHLHLTSAVVTCCARTNLTFVNRSRNKPLSAYASARPLPLRNLIAPAPFQAEKHLTSSHHLLAKNDYVQAADAVASADALLADLQRAEAESTKGGGRRAEGGRGSGVDKENRRNTAGMIYLELCELCEVCEVCDMRSEERLCC